MSRRRQAIALCTSPQMLDLVCDVVLVLAAVDHLVLLVQRHRTVARAEKARAAANELLARTKANLPDVDIVTVDVDPGRQTVLITAPAAVNGDQPARPRIRDTPQA